MDLFNEDDNHNLLPKDGTVIYYGKILDRLQAQNYLELLLANSSWQNDEAIIFGKHFITKRKVAWYGDFNYAYTYSNTTRHALPWTTALLELKQLVETISERTYNSCLLNLYHDGDEGMSWHSDDEKTLGKNAAIASLSLGAERKFDFKHKETNEKISVFLENGSLLLMEDETQANWLHQLPKTKKVNQPRVNLTFRTMVQAE